MKNKNFNKFRKKALSNSKVKKEYDKLQIKKLKKELKNLTKDTMFYKLIIMFIDNNNNIDDLDNYTINLIKSKCFNIIDLINKLDKAKNEKEKN